MRYGRWERGQGMVLALIVLGATALFAVPAMGLASTAVLGARQRGERVLDWYAADGGVEHALWRIQYQSGFASSLTPSPTYTQTFNGRNTTITVAAAPTPTPPPPQCPVLQGGQICVVASVSPSVLTAGVFTAFTYNATIYNNGTSKVHLGQLGDLLPATYAYVTGSASSTGIINNTNNFVLGDPAIAIVNGAQQLVWNFGSPAPWISAGMTATMTLQATATPTQGTYPNQAWAQANPNDIGLVGGALVSTGGPNAVVAYYPEYDVTSGAGAITVKVRAEQPTAGIVIRSWQQQ